MDFARQHGGCGSGVWDSHEQSGRSRKGSERLTMDLWND